MSAIQKFQDYFKVTGVSVKFYANGIDTGNMQFLKDVKFCQAVKLARNQQVFLDKDSIICKGARYALGFDTGTKEEIVNAIKFKRGVSREIAEQLVNSIPRVKDATYNYIGLSVDDPDIFIFYMTPKRFMEFLKVYQRTGNNLEVKLSSLTAMCGDVAAQTLTTKKICISFGCDDSREYGEVADEELIVGIPKDTIEKLANKIL
jgi:uncharacterized protein (DUF169 family)